jgi:hypothetical protein
MADFEALHQALSREIEPRGIVEEMYVHEIACVTWEIVRLRRCKTNLLDCYLGEPPSEAGLFLGGFARVDLLDKMLLALEARRDKSLVFIGQYRASLAQQLRESASRIIEMQTTNVPLVEDASGGAAANSPLETAPGDGHDK